MHDLISICQILLWEFRFFLRCILYVSKLWLATEKCLSFPNPTRAIIVLWANRFTFLWRIFFGFIFNILLASFDASPFPSTFDQELKCEYLYLSLRAYIKLMIKGHTNQLNNQPTNQQKKNKTKFVSFTQIFLFEDVTRWSIYQLTHAKLDPCFVFLFATGFCYRECLTRPKRLLLLLVIFFWIETYRLKQKIEMRTNWNNGLHAEICKN